MKPLKSCMNQMKNINNVFCLLLNLKTYRLQLTLITFINSKVKLRKPFVVSSIVFLKLITTY